MIMTNKIFTIFLAAFLILVSCSKDEEIINTNTPRPLCGRRR